VYEQYSWVDVDIEVNEIRDQLCLGCGAKHRDAFCPQCGFRVVQTENAAPPSRTITTPSGVFTVDAWLERLPGLYRGQGTGSDGQPVFVVVETPDAPSLVDPKAAQEWTVPVLATGEEDNARYTIYSADEMTSLPRALADVISNGDTLDPIQLIERYLVPLCALFARVHDSDIWLGRLNPSDIVFDATGTARLLPPCDFHGDLDDTEQPFDQISDTFSAPERYGRCTGEITPQTDVYFLGIFGYALLTRVLPPNGCGAETFRLPVPRVYRGDVPHLLGAAIMKAASPYPWRRYKDGSTMLRALKDVLGSEKRRREYGQRTLSLDIGDEIHIGLVKSLYSPVNQDDLFVGFDELASAGLFVVTDGVSICHYGSGDLASGCVRHAAAQLWNRLSVTPALSGPDETLTIEEEQDLQREVSTIGTAEERQAQLRDMLAAANDRIGDTVSPSLPASIEPTQSIMAATAVAMLLDRNRATIASIGDSRVYLLRGEHIAQLTLDHNLKTQLIRNGHSPLTAHRAQGAAALVRCVGEFTQVHGELISSPLQPEFVDLTLMPGDRIVLCSDGVIDYIDFDEEGTEERIHRLVSQAANAKWGAFELMVAANRGGGGDNISCIVIHFEELTGPI